MSKAAGKALKDWETPYPGKDIQGDRKAYDEARRKEIEQDNQKMDDITFSPTLRSSGDLIKAAQLISDARDALNRPGFEKDHQQPVTWLDKVTEGLATADDLPAFDADSSVVRQYVSGKLREAVEEFEKAARSDLADLLKAEFAGYLS